MKLITDYSTREDFQSDEIVWFGNQANVVVSGELGSGATLKLYWRGEKFSPEHEVSALNTGFNMLHIPPGFLYVRYNSSNTSDPTDLSVNVLEMSYRR